MAKSGESRESWSGDHTNHYDQYGNKTGESRKAVFGNHVNHYDASGRKIGESRDAVFGDQTIHTDSSGEKIGESRSAFFGDHTNHYDASGRKIGESREALFGDHVNHYDAAYPLTGNGSLITPPPHPYADLAEFGGGGLSEKEWETFLSPRTRWGLFGLHILAAIAAALLTIPVSILAAFSSTVTDRLELAVTYHYSVGPGFLFAGVQALAMTLVIGMILFEASTPTVFAAVNGLSVGSVVLIIGLFFMPMDYWGAWVPWGGWIAGFTLVALHSKYEARKLRGKH